VDDARRVQQLTAEVRSPSARLTIVQTPNAVTLTDDRGQSRTFHPDGKGDKEEVLQLDGVPVGVTAKREAGRPDQLDRACVRTDHRAPGPVYGRLCTSAALRRSTTLTIEVFCDTNEAEQWLAAQSMDKPAVLFPVAMYALSAVESVRSAGGPARRWNG
jgi:hypothetical protein